MEQLTIGAIINKSASHAKTFSISCMSEEDLYQAKCIVNKALKAEGFIVDEKTGFAERSRRTHTRTHNY